MAGGGIKRGYVHRQLDDYGFNVVDRGVHVHDLPATILHVIGIDHQKLTFLFQGRQFRLTDVGGRLVEHFGVIVSPTFWGSAWHGTFRQVPSPPANDS
jgi:hypothetical protein